MTVAIQPALRTKDGMDFLVLIFNVHLIHTTMALSACVQILKTVVCHGNTMMEYSVSISQGPVLLELPGMEPSASPTQPVLSGSISRILNVMLSLKNVCHHHNGTTDVAKSETLALMALISEAELAFLTYPVKTGRFGTTTRSTVLVPRELNGTEINVLLVQEEKDGNLLLAVFAQLAHSSPDHGAKESTNLDVI